MDRAAKLAHDIEASGGVAVDSSIVRILREHRELISSIERVKLMHRELNDAEELLKLAQDEAPSRETNEIERDCTNKINSIFIEAQEMNLESLMGDAGTQSLQFKKKRKKSQLFLSISLVHSLKHAGKTIIIIFK